MIIEINFFFRMILEKNLKKIIIILKKRKNNY